MSTLIYFIKTAFPRSFLLGMRLFLVYHCVKSLHIRGYSGPYFPAFGLNTGRYSVSLRIQSECVKIRTGINPNTDHFYAVCISPPEKINDLF